MVGLTYFPRLPWLREITLTAACLAPHFALADQCESKAPEMCSIIDGKCVCGRVTHIGGRERAEARAQERVQERAAAADAADAAERAQGRAETRVQSKRARAARAPAAVEERVGAATASPIPVSEELWRNITAPPSAPWTGVRPSVFTYVLAGSVTRQQKYEGSDDQVIHARANLAALVREVRAMDPAAKSTPATIRSANIFCVPSSGGTDASTAQYDFSLAADYRQQLSVLLVGRTELEGKLGRVGPFLVATRMPLNEFVKNDALGKPQIHPKGHILLIDLSDAEPDSVIVFVNVFKAAIRSEAVQADAELRPLRGQLVSAMVRLNAAIPFIGSAYARTTALPGVAPQKSEGERR